jgi:hypothetical protein
MYASIVSPQWPDDTSRLVDPSRLAIYRDMYPMRMHDAMAVDYPALAKFLGEEKFHELVDRYTEHHPSQSYTLNRLGDPFPEFLRGTDTPVCADRTDKSVCPTFLHDLARLELAMTEVFDAEETPELDPAVFGSIGPDSRLKTIAAFQLHAFDYPVNDFFQSFRDGEELVEPERQKTWIAFHRRDYGVFRLTLEERAYDFLSALCDGATIVEAIDGTGATQDELFGWFRDWSAAGIFGGIE